MIMDWMTIALRKGTGICIRPLADDHRLHMPSSRTAVELSELIINAHEDGFRFHCKRRSAAMENGGADLLLLCRDIRTEFFERSLDG